MYMYIAGETLADIKMKQGRGSISQFRPLGVRSRRRFGRFGVEMEYADLEWESIREFHRHVFEWDEVLVVLCDGGGYDF